MTVTAVGFGAGVAGSVILCPMTAIREVVPTLVELEVAVPRLSPAVR